MNTTTPVNVQFLYGTEEEITKLGQGQAGQFIVSNTGDIYFNYPDEGMMSKTAQLTSALDSLGNTLEAIPFKEKTDTKKYLNQNALFKGTVGLMDKDGTIVNPNLGKDYHVYAYDYNQWDIPRFATSQLHFKGVANKDYPLIIFKTESDSNIEGETGLISAIYPSDILESANFNNYDDYPLSVELIPENTKIIYVNTEDALKPDGSEELIWRFDY
jgi:hypothetical protein